MDCLCVLAALSVLSDAHVLEVGNGSQGKQDLSPARNQQSWISKLKTLKQQPVGVSLQVFQPNYGNVTVGDTVVLTCSYNSRENSTQGRYKWFFTNSTSSSSSREIEVSNTNQKFNGRVFKSGDSNFTSQQEANIEIHNVQHDDTGKYVCEVELFTVTNSKGRGNGTRLLVLDAPQNQGLTIPLYWMSLYLSTTVVCRLLAAFVMTVSLRKRK